MATAGSRDPDVPRRITGSPAYTAPEVLQGHPSQATSDMYSLASTLFSAGTGHAVYERRKGEQVVAQFLRITESPMPDLRASGLPTDFCEVIGRAMSRDPCDRPATAVEFGELLRETQRRHGMPADDIPGPTSGPGRRHRFRAHRRADAEPVPGTVGGHPAGPGHQIPPAHAGPRPCTA